MALWKSCLNCPDFENTIWALLMAGARVLPCLLASAWAIEGLCSVFSGFRVVSLQPGSSSDCSMASVNPVVMERVQSRILSFVMAGVIPVPCGVSGEL